MTKPITLVPELRQTVAMTISALSAMMAEIRTEWETAEADRRTELALAYRRAAKLMTRSRRAQVYPFERYFADPQCEARDEARIGEHRAAAARTLDEIRRGTLHYLRTVIEVLRIVRPALASRCGDFLGAIKDFTEREVYPMVLVLTRDLGDADTMMRQVNYALQMLGCARDKWMVAE